MVQHSPNSLCRSLATEALIYLPQPLADSNLRSKGSFCLQEATID